MKSTDFAETLEYNEKTERLTQSIVQGSKVQVDVVQERNLTSLDLLSAVVPYTIADATCDVSYHRSHMSEDMEAFGQKGADDVEAFKNNWLSEYSRLGLAAYKLEDPFEADLKELKVTLGFECTIQGHEGKGTDYVFINEDKLLTKIIAIRH